MYIVICKTDSGRFLPILAEDEETLATFETGEEAEGFADDHIFCASHETRIIDIDV